MTALLEASGVTVRYGGLVAVDAVSVELDRDEVVGLIGPNGAGKTSLFEALSGFVTPQAGRVRFDGDDVTDRPVHQRASAGLTRTFQRLELFGHMTVLDNLLVAAEARQLEYGVAADVVGLRRTADIASDRASDVAFRLGLGAVRDRLAGELPAGLGRLVEIGRALCGRPKALLLDEPTAGLDEAETDALAAALREATAGDGPALFVVEHDVPFVSDLADRIYVMEFGRIIAHGTPDEIRGDPEVRRAYLGNGS